jgi:terminase, large subunit
VTPRRITCRPAWWPCDYPAAMAGRAHVYRMGAERLRLKKPKRRPVSEWAERFRVLSQSSRPGPWRNATARYLAGIMDAIDHPSVETVVFCKPPQSGGSEAVHNFVGSRIDMDPGEVLYVYPDDQTASLNCKDRIQPMLTASPRLSSYLTGSEDDISSRRIRLRHMVIYLASAHSASQLANKPCRYVIFDETDKYPAECKGEADPISLGRKRTTTYAHSRKMIELSTPTVESGAIWSSLMTAQVVFHFWCRCPHCGELQTMLFHAIKWDGGSKADPNDVGTYNLAWYECRQCSRPWSDDERDDAVRAGEWRADSGGHPLFADRDAAAGEARGLPLFKAMDRLQPKKIGFHIPAWVSPFVSLSECAAAFLAGMRDSMKLRDFSNAYEAVPWREVRAERKEDEILALCDEHDEGVVPEWADVLTCGADTQDNGFWYEIRAWEIGPELRSHGVRRGFVESLDALDEVLLKTAYMNADGVDIPLVAGLIDAMGHRTAEVYDWCRTRRIIRPSKGEARMARPFEETRIDTMPGSKRAIPGGLVLQRVHVNFYKDKLASKLQISIADPGSFGFSRDLHPAHARHYVSEYVDQKTGGWVCPEHKANHLWDCSVLAMAAAMVARLHLPKKEATATRAQRHRPQQERRARW